MINQLNPEAINTMLQKTPQRRGSDKEFWSTVTNTESRPEAIAGFSGTSAAGRREAEGSKSLHLGRRNVFLKDDEIINIHTATMNCGGRLPASVHELLPLFEVTGKESEDRPFVPDIYIIGLQEIVKLNPKNILMQDRKRIDEWRSRLTEALEVINRNHHKGMFQQEYDQSERLVACADTSMVGCFIALFIKQKLAKRIKQDDIQTCKIKTGNLGTTGNKGAVCIRFRIEDQSVMAINCHLMSGRRRIKERIEEVAKIFEEAYKQHLRNRAMSVERHEQVFLLGDLNFRVDGFSREQVLALIHEKKISDILQEDDLVKLFDKFNLKQVKFNNKYADMLFRRFQEGFIRF